MPISGYQIEAEHPPIDSTIGLKMFCKFTFKSFLPELQKMFICFMPQSTLKEQYTGLYA